MTKKYILFGIFALSIVVSLLAVLVWQENNNWQFSNLSAYKFFPLFGLLAFSLLWSQYVAIAAMHYFQLKGSELKLYFQLTGYVVLIAILLHPSLLIWQLWQDGFGLPPQSYLQHYIAPGLGWATGLGMLAFLIFLSYELRRFFAKKSWWKWIIYAGDLAMIAIFIHSLALGSHLQSGWYRNVWLFYGITLLGCLFYLRLWPVLRKLHF